MQCPHCLEFFNRQPDPNKVGRDLLPDENRADNKSEESKEGPGEYELPAYGVSAVNCTACGRLIVQLFRGNQGQMPRRDWYLTGPLTMSWVVPIAPNRMRFAAEIPLEFKRDYDQAASVVSISPAASAALSRRCLQNIIRNKVKIKRKNLYLEVEELLATGGLPTHLQQVLHPVRELGNIAAHPINSEVTAEVLPVDPEEADLCLNAIELLLDFYFVQPKIASDRLKRLSSKLDKPAD